MKLNWLTALTVPMTLVPALCTSVHAQSGKADAAHGRLVRVGGDDDADDGDSKSQSFDADAWRKRLKQPDLDARQHDFDALVKRARREKSVREAIDRWAHDSADSDLAWTSRLLQREIEAQRKRSTGRANDSLGNGGANAPGWDDLQSRFDELEKQFGGMDSQFGRLQEELDRMLRDQPQFHGSTPGAGGSSTAKSFTLQVGPDGVTCRVRENIDGKEQTKEYKAESLEALLDAHPELRDQIGASGNGLGWSGGLFHGGQGFTWGDGGSKHALRAPLSGNPRTDMLGIEFSKLSPDESKSLNLEPERGLHVDRVVPGTIAQILGIRRGDTLIEMNGVPLYGKDDVSKLMRERAPDAEVVVVLIDEKGQRRTLTWRPASEGEQGSATSPSTKRDPSKKF
jgi:hypothetical protein